ncbi:MAG: hypothetical protein K0R15_2358 [Clostridiales bacterium]|jgi:lichenan operon transcriptional antiterminator|nr:hypothetical protein [Clostridiales bacterium]
MLGERLTNLLSLLSQDDFQTAEIFAKKLNTSTKTVRNLLKQLEDNLLDNGARIIAKSGYGYKLSINNLEKFSDFLSIDKSYLPNTSQERVQYLLEYFLSSKEHIKTEDLCDMLCVSKKTLAVDLKEVERMLGKYNVSLERKPYYGMKVIGDEFHIRLCIAESTEIKMQRNIFAADDEIQKSLSKIADCVMESIALENYQISDVALQNLIIHLHIAIKRIESSNYIPLEISDFHKWVKEDEYQLAKKCTDKIGEIFHMEFPEQEIAYVAVHLAGKKSHREEPEGSDNIVINSEINEMVTAMLEEIYQVFRIELRNDLELIISLGQHLIPLTVRIQYGMKMKNPLLKQIKERFSLAYTMASQACVVFKQRYHKVLEDDEIGYIALALALALERQRTCIEKKTILLVCSSGAGSAKLLSYKLQDLFRDCIKEIQTCDSRSLGKMDFQNIDYIFTTVPITDFVPVPICEIKYFMETKDINAMRKLLNSEDKCNTAKYYPPELFFSEVDLDTKQAVIKYLCQEIGKKRDIPNGFYAAVMKREELAQTSFGNMVAMPHPYKVMTKETFVSVCILKKPIQWSENQMVRAVFLVSIENTPNKNIKDFYKITSQLLLSKTWTTELIKKGTYTTLMEILNQIENKMEND